MIRSLFQDTLKVRIGGVTSPLFEVEDYDGQLRLTMRWGEPDSFERIIAFNDYDVQRVIGLRDALTRWLESRQFDEAR